MGEVHKIVVCSCIRLNGNTVSPVTFMILIQIQRNFDYEGLLLTHYPCDWNFLRSLNNRKLENIISDFMKESVHSIKTIPTSFDKVDFHSTFPIKSAQMRD